jgi:CheY-like chemotaxis protein
MTKTILVIEDENEIRCTLKEFLEFEGYEVMTADNGLSAMKLLEKIVMPHLILLDMKMPIMNGWEFAAAFFAQYDHKAPIIVITAAADAEQRAKDINATDWVEKPFNMESLFEKIKRHAK